MTAVKWPLRGGSECILQTGRHVAPPIGDFAMLDILEAAAFAEKDSGPESAQSWRTDSKLGKVLQVLKNGMVLNDETVCV